MSKILTNADGNIKLELKDDRLSAWLTITDTGHLANEQEILDLIDQAGIKTGFEEAARYMRKRGIDKDFATAFPIAMCERNPGEAKLNYYFDLESARGFTGHVTLAEMNRLTCIEAGTVIADYSSNIFDRQGSIYDIYGEMFRAEDVDQGALESATGANVRFDAGRNQFIAECAGFPSVSDDGCISIVDNLEISGWTESGAEDLRSPVGLTLDGDVADTRITAAGSIRISGGVRNCGIYCQGDLVVGREIVDCQQPGLEIAGGISCAGIKDSRVLCQGKVAFSGQIVGSEIYADGGLKSATGILSGGHLESGGDIEVEKLGEPQGTPTEVEITISPYRKALMMQMTKELIHRKQAQQPSAKQVELLNARIRECEQELDRELNEYLQQQGQNRLKLSVRQDVFPPVRIRILKHEYTITAHQKQLEILEKD